MAIMPLSKRIRYEILKRDNHTCRYCGGSAPDVKLTVDHVTPTALGGSDQPDNLVAACHDCNAGKSSTSPDAETVAQVGEDDMRWAEAVKRAADALREKHANEKASLDWFSASWAKWDPDGDHLPTGWIKSVNYWTGAGLPQDMLLDCLDIALGNRSVAHAAVFAYMGGVARKRIEELHASARALLDAEASDGA